MIRLSIQARQALGRLILPVLIAVSFGVMLLGKADALLRSGPAWLADGLGRSTPLLAAPLGQYAAVAEPPPCGTCARKTPACATKTRSCGAGSRSRWRWMRKTSG